MYGLCDRRIDACEACKRLVDYEQSSREPSNALIISSTRCFSATAPVTICGLGRKGSPTSGRRAVTKRVRPDDMPLVLRKREGDNLRSVTAGKERIMGRQRRRDKHLARPFRKDCVEYLRQPVAEEYVLGIDIAPSRPNNASGGACEGPDGDARP